MREQEYEFDEWQPKQRSKNWLDGYVYIIDYGDGSTFKIGHTTGDPQKRLNQIARGNVIMPMKLVMAAKTGTNCHQLEDLIQMHFDYHHVQGEWFKLDFVMLIEVHRCLRAFADCVELYERWFELVPDDYERYISGFTIGGVLPSFTREEFETRDLTVERRRPVRVHSAHDPSEDEIDFGAVAESGRRILRRASYFLGDGEWDGESAAR